MFDKYYLIFFTEKSPFEFKHTPVCLFRTIPYKNMTSQYPTEKKFQSNNFILGYNIFSANSAEMQCKFEQKFSIS